MFVSNYRSPRDVYSSMKHSSIMLTNRNRKALASARNFQEKIYRYLLIPNPIVALSSSLIEKSFLPHHNSEYTEPWVIVCVNPLQTFTAVVYYFGTGDSPKFMPLEFYHYDIDSGVSFPNLSRFFEDLRSIRCVHYCESPNGPSFKVYGSRGSTANDTPKQYHIIVTGCHGRGKAFALSSTIVTGAHGRGKAFDLSTTYDRQIGRAICR